MSKQDIKTVSVEDMCPSWKIKTVKPINQFYSSNFVEERIEALKTANWNLENQRCIPSTPFLFSFTGGNSALSAKQYSALYDGDEAYAGARDFYVLENSIRENLGYDRIVPTHNGVAAAHIFNNVACIKQGSIVVVNDEGFPIVFSKYHIENRVVEQKRIVRNYGKVIAFRENKLQFPFNGNLDINRLGQFLESEDGKKVSYIFMCCSVEGSQTEEQPFSITNLRQVRDLSQKYAVPIIVEASNITGNAYIIKEYEDEFKNKSIKEIIKTITDLTDGAIISCEDEFLSNLGGIIAFKKNQIMEKNQWLIHCQAQLVEYEGLHTYGGLSGRDMGCIAQGIREAVEDDHVRQRIAQTRYLNQQLNKNGVPTKISAATSTIYIDCEQFLSYTNKQYSSQSLAVALAVCTGILTSPSSEINKPVLRIYVPSRTYTINQLQYVVDALSALFKLKSEIPEIIEVKEKNQDLHDFSEALKVYQIKNIDGLERLAKKIQTGLNFESVETWYIRAVEATAQKSAKEREQALVEAGYNTFLLKMEDGIAVDLLTDSGTNAMSINQWTGLNHANDFGGDAYQNVVKSVQEVYGFEFVIPTHQGRMAEFILSQNLIREGDIVPGNMYFTTTKFHQEFAGATFYDVIIDEAHDSMNTHPFKGNIDTKKLIKLIEGQIAQFGSPRMPYISMAGPVNMAGGQPFSMANLKEVRKIIDEYNHKYPFQPIRLVFDATRAIENCEMIKEREEGYADYTNAQMLKKICDYFEAATMSSKKDNLVNIGGFLAIRKSPFTVGLYEKCMITSTLYDGNGGNSGLSSRNLECLAIGIKEMLCEKYMHARLTQVRKFAKYLQEYQVPIVQPVGGHGVFIDAQVFLRDEKGNEIIPKEQYKAQSLAAAIFQVSGLRSMERGAVSAGRDHSGKEIYPQLELVRLTIPRRVYLDEHLQLAAKQIGELYKNRSSIKGLKLVYEPPALRFFQARFQKI